MIIKLADSGKLFRLMVSEAKKLLDSGMMPDEWTRANIQRFLVC